MKLKFWFGLMILAALFIGSGNMALAFHDGGVAECAGCHSMHAPKAGPNQALLLVGTDQSSTCLSCHEHAGDTGPSSYHVSTAPANMPAGTAPLQRTPGGDFGWLKKSYSFSVRNTPTTELGQSHGHNIVAFDQGYVADSSNNTAPGGSFVSSQLACNSCHDPHGKYRRDSGGAFSTSGGAIKGSGSYSDASFNASIPTAPYTVGAYRLLAGQGYSKATYPGVPVAVTPSTYNRTEAVTQTRTAYGYGQTKGSTTWGNWCATCHPAMHSSNGVVHPIDHALTAGIDGLYAGYRNSGSTTGNAAATSFLSLVPFVEGTGDFTVLASHARNNDTSLGGPGSSDQVSCLSCHRAHASGWQNALRWNGEYEMITYVDSGNNPVWPGTDNQAASNGALHMGRLSGETQAAYYDRPVTIFGAYQRSLCNKCHAKD